LQTAACALVSTAAASPVLYPLSLHDALPISADVAAHVHFEPGRLQDRADQRRRGGLPAGAGNPDDGRAAPVEKEVDLGADGNARLSGPADLLQVLAHARREENAFGGLEALEIPGPQAHLDAQGAELVIGGAQFRFALLV